MSALMDVLTAGSGLSDHDVMKIVWNAPSRYKLYEIPKRQGGHRLISQPAREVKALQRILTSEILSTLPVHHSATAYRLGKSIKDNAAAHAANGPIKKYDFRDFFPSIVAKDWRSYCQRYGVFSDPRDIWISTNLLFHRRPGSSRLNLAIGAPSSPSLSNVLMNDFDIRLSELVAQEQVTYTRYADDLTFSARRTGFLTRVERMLRQAIRETANPTLTLNNSKTVVATTKYKRFVTGLVLTNDHRVSLGHQRKRTIRAALHHYLNGKLDIAEQAQLAGMIAFASDIEPDFIVRLQAKYGSAAFQQLKSARLPARPLI
ncbi:retron St85 family RNA-directed DNA polymerase [Bradyrhizobium sp. BR 1433]|uniref:retron St85 family RNA-directed DNA polymerase n=1 Tax=Bradyrhizobium sp. BR 1433 TaxID=3447967 RepID=UPI003EE579E0